METISIDQLEPTFCCGRVYKFAYETIGLGRFAGRDGWLPTDAFREAMRPALCAIEASSHKWYVYAHVMDGRIRYIGKGSGNRVANMTRTARWIGALRQAESLEARILSWHDHEAEAYIAERALISDLLPDLNGKIRDKIVRLQAVNRAA